MVKIVYSLSLVKTIPSSKTLRARDNYYPAETAASNTAYASHHIISKVA
jgi:hypothetical protein